tara:strand:+ start:6293 stop:6433 length:141 start_codon:yes stop_codon:yes gene_type:complete
MSRDVLAVDALVAFSPSGGVCASEDDVIVDHVFEDVWDAEFVEFIA